MSLWTPQDRSCAAAKAATIALVVATRATVDRCSLGHVQAPLRPTETEDGQGTSRRRSGRIPSLGGRCAAILPGRRRRSTCRRLPARPAVCRVWTAGVEQMADSTPGVPMLEAPVQQLGCSVVGRVLGRWEPLPPQAREQSVLEQAVGHRRDSAGGCQASHGDAGDGLVRGPSESVYSPRTRRCLSSCSSTETETGTCSAKLCRRPEIRQVQFLGRMLIACCYATTYAWGWICRKLWRFRSCSRCSSWKVVDMPVRVQRQVGSDSAENRAGAAGAVHRRGVEPLAVFNARVGGGFLLFFKGIFRTPSIWTLSPGFHRTFWGALDDGEFFVNEGSGVAGTPGV